MTKIISRCFAGAGIVFSADTLSKEYKSRTFMLGQYFSVLTTDVSAHPTRTNREQKKLFYAT